MAVSDSVMRAISSRPQSTQRRPSMRSISSDAATLVLARVPAHEHVLEQRVVEVAQRRGADRVQRGDDADPVRDQLGCLLGSRALPHPDRPRRLAGDRGRERDGGVDHQLPRPQRVPDFGQRVGLAAKRHAQDDGLGRARGGRVLVRGERALRDLPARAIGRLVGARSANASRSRSARRYAPAAAPARSPTRRRRR